MTIKSVIKMGNAKLATPSLSVTNFSNGEIKELVSDMQDTMKEKGGVGIAAPQIGCNLRVIMFGFEHSERYPNEKPVPFTVLINPVIETLSDEMIDGWEGCLSVPGLRGLVPRYKKIQSFQLIYSFATRYQNVEFLEYYRGYINELLAIGDYGYKTIRSIYEQHIEKTITVPEINTDKSIRSFSPFLKLISRN